MQDMEALKSYDVSEESDTFIDKITIFYNIFMKWDMDTSVFERFGFSKQFYPLFIDNIA